jgi:diguanylate cyclase (GGDEF)-like protein/PAS domain S-box-containing protein
MKTEEQIPLVEPMDPTFYQGLLDHIGDGVYFVDRERRILYWNHGARKLTGYEPGDVLGRCCQEDILCHIDIEGNRLCKDGCPLQASIADGTAREAHVFLRHKDGRRIPVNVRVQAMRDHSGSIVGAVEIFSDASADYEMRRRAEAMKRMAYLDHLTQLPNRRFLEAALKGLLSGKQEEGEPFGVLMIDLDGFKKINDTYGHIGGDEALKVAGRTLAGALRPTDVVGRWGGDEFLAIVSGVSEEIMGELARRCVMLVERTRLQSEGGEFGLSISVGATLVRPDDNMDVLIHRADELMYCSKSQGRGRATMK